MEAPEEYLDPDACFTEGNPGGNGEGIIDLSDARDHLSMSTQEPFILLG